MEILLITSEPVDEIKILLEQLNSFVQIAPPNNIPPIEKNPAIIFINAPEGGPPETINPEIHSVLFIDTSYVTHPPTCYAFSKQWVKQLLPIALFLFEQDAYPENDPEMEKLFREYRRTLFTKLQLIISLFEKAINNPTKEELEQLKHHVHKTAGSAGTYGFLEVSKVCKELENELIEFLKRFNKESNISFPQEKKEDYLKRIFEGCRIHKGNPTNSQPTEISQEVIDKHQAQPSSFDFYYVDDDQELINIIAAEAKKRTVSFDFDTSFEKAKQKISNPSFSPKVALFDIFTPNEQISGYDLIQTFREVRKESLTSLIGIISEKAELPDRVKASQLGIDVYFEKPVNINFLLSQIEKVTRSKTKKEANILLVDDDEEFCQLVEQTLQKAGFKLSYITDSQYLFPKIQEIHPEIILLDINLPHQSGIELLRTLRTDFRNRNITVIMVTVSTSVEDVKNAYAAGAQDFLSKPVDFKKLPEYLQDFLRKKEYMGLVYEKDPDFGLYTDRSLRDFFATFSFRHSSFCTVFIHVIYEEKTEEVTKETKKWVRDKLISFFSEKDVIGMFNGIFVLEIVDYTIEQVLVMLEALHESIRSSIADHSDKIALISITTHFPNDGSTLEEVFDVAEHIFQEKHAPWGIFSSVNKKETIATLKVIKNIVLISSDMQLRTVLANALQLRDISVLPYETGKEGYEYLLRHFFHEKNSAVILDGDLDNENGYVILQKIKSIVGQKTPLFFLTGLTKEEDLSEGLNLGATRIFSKPIQLHVFLDSLEKDIQG